MQIRVDGLPLTDDRQVLQIMSGSGVAWSVAEGAEGDIELTPSVVGGSLFSETDANAALALAEGGAKNNSLKIAPTANKSNSASVGGALYIDNSLSAGVGLGVYSTNAAPTGNLAFIRANHASFNQRALRVHHSGSGIGVDVLQDGTGIGLQVVGSGGATSGAHAVAISLSNSGSASSSALSVLSNNQAHSALQVTGNETGRGTVKIAHVGQPGLDANASALSIDVQNPGGGTAAQGIFLDATGGGTTGNLIEVRNNGAFAFRVDSAGNVDIANVQVLTSRRTGWGAPTGTATRTTFATSTVTTAQLAERVKALIDDLTTHGLIGA